MIKIPNAIGRFEATPARCRASGSQRVATGWPPLLLACIAWLGAVGGAMPARAAASSTSRPALVPYPAWAEACRKLPTNRQLGDRGMPPRDLLPLPTFADFSAALEPFLESARTGGLARSETWFGGGRPGAAFFNPDRGYYEDASVPFQPFAQREIVPAGTRLIFHGDLHGDIHSLMAFLESLNRRGDLDGFRVARPEVRLIFLGDYTDRGRYGMEVLYTILRLKLTSPTQVWLVRGNHEDVTLVTRYGFLAEASAKYGGSLDARRIVRLYDFLPTVLYVGTGTNVLQCNHGGIEPGYDPAPLLAAPAKVTYQLLGRLEQKRWLSSQSSWVAGLPAPTRRALETSLVDFEPASPISPTVLGFMWNDFTVLPSEPQFAIDPGRAFVYGNQTVGRFLESRSAPTHRIRALFRAHQHSSELNPLMRRLIASRGVFRHWQSGDRAAPAEPTVEVLGGWIETAEERGIPDGSVWTFNVSPDSVYGLGCGFAFDTAGELTTAERWEDWRLVVRNLAVPGVNGASSGEAGR